MSGGIPKNENDLTAKQQLFCEEYLVDLNATQAAIRAGYSERTADVIGCENLGKPSIAQFIAKLKADRSERVELSADYVVSRLMKVANRCMQEEPVKSPESDSDEVIGEYKFEHAGANKSLELLGRHLGIFNDKLDIDAITTVHFNLEYGDGKTED